MAGETGESIENLQQASVPDTQGEHPADPRATIEEFAQTEYPNLTDEHRTIGVTAAMQALGCDEAELDQLVDEMDASTDPRLIAELERMGPIRQRAVAMVADLTGRGLPQDRVPTAQLQILRREAAGTLARVAVGASLGSDPKSALVPGQMSFDNARATADVVSLATGIVQKFSPS